MTASQQESSDGFDAATATSGNDNSSNEKDSSQTTRSTCYRLVALDLDGTLLSSKHEISDATIQLMHQLYGEKGVKFIIATGRAAPTTYDVVRRLQMPYPMPVVCSNGAKGIVVDCGSKGGSSSNSNNDDTNNSNASGDCKVTELFSTPVPVALTRKVVRLAKELDHVTQYYWQDDIYANPRADPHFVFTRRYSQLTGSDTIFVDDDDMEFESVLAEKGPPSKLLVMCPEGDLDDVFARFQAEIGPEATLVKGSKTPVAPSGWFLEILHPAVSKGNGLKLMCAEHLHVPLEETVAFGDGSNDKEFLQYAGLGIAMANADATVTAVADMCTDVTNDEDGVRKMLRQLDKQGFFQTER